jgi:hypothetical protein
MSLFKYILRMSNNMKESKNILVLSLGDCNLLENDPVLLRQVDQIICLARFLYRCVGHPTRTSDRSNAKEWTFAAVVYSSSCVSGVISIGVPTCVVCLVSRLTNRLLLKFLIGSQPPSFRRMFAGVSPGE